MASEKFGEQLDRVAELLAQRAKRKLGAPRELQVAGRERELEPQPAPVAILPDWTTIQAIDVSPRARKMHAIMAIANAHSWQAAITHFLICSGAPYLSDLTDAQLDDLLRRMQGYVDAAEMGACLPDCLPAS